MFDLKLKNKESYISTLNNPFQHNCVERIVFWISKTSISATIYFENRNTKGEQKINATSFEELLIKTKEFLTKEMNDDKEKTK